MFDLKNNPWCIRVNTEQEFVTTNEWLREVFRDNCLSIGYNVGYSVVRGITNVDARGVICNHLMWMKEQHFNTYHKTVPEIKIKFKTVIESVEYPEVKSEAQKQLDNVMQKLAELQKEAEQLQETIKKEKQ